MALMTIKVQTKQLVGVCSINLSRKFVNWKEELQCCQNCWIWVFWVVASGGMKYLVTLPVRLRQAKDLEKHYLTFCLNWGIFLQWSKIKVVIGVLTFTYMVFHKPSVKLLGMTREVKWRQRVLLSFFLGALASMLVIKRKLFDSASSTRSTVSLVFGLLKYSFLSTNQNITTVKR